MKKTINQLSRLIADRITKDNAGQVAQEVWWTLIRQKQYGRLQQLLDMVDRQLVEKENKLKVELACHKEPTEEELAIIRTKLEEKFDKKIELTTRVDQSLLGGFKIVVDDYTIDLSYKEKLKQLKLKLAGVNE